MYKLFLTLRYLRKRRIAYFAIGAVTLCVAMVLIVMSVMSGFLDQLKNKARGLLGDIIVDNRSYAGFPLYQEFIDEIRTWPEIEQATPVIYAWGLLRFPETDQTNTVRAVGIRLNEVYGVNAFRGSLFYEKHYPGTTHLGEQQQPLIGYDLNAEYLPLKDEEGNVVLHAPRPQLPEEFQKGLQAARAANVDETDVVPTRGDAMLKAAGMPIFPGVFDSVTEPGPPAYSGDPWPGLIIGRDIVCRRTPDGRYERYSAYPRGCRVTLTLLPISIKGSVDTPIKQPFRYVDDSRTGVYEIDSQHVYCNFELLQRLLDMAPAPRADGDGIAPGRCSQIQIKLRPGHDPHDTAVRLQKRYLSLLSDPRFEQLDSKDRRLIQLVEAMTWEESQRHVIAPVEKERLLMSTVLGVISLVAVVLVLCILYMIVLQKTRDIGIIKSIGASSAGVASIFLVYGAAVGVVGSVLGATLGALFVRNINPIQDWLISLNPNLRVWDMAVYSFDSIPDQVRASDVVTVVATAIVASTVGALAAAWHAKRMHPVEALRYE